MIAAGRLHLPLQPQVLLVLGQGLGLGLVVSHLRLQLQQQQRLLLLLHAATAVAKALHCDACVCKRCTFPFCCGWCSAGQAVPLCKVRIRYLSFRISVKRRGPGSTLAPKLSFWGSVKKLASQASVKKLTGQTSVKPPKPAARGALVPEGSVRKGFGLSSQGSVKKLVSWSSVQGKASAPKPAAAPAAVAAAELQSGSFSSSSRGLLKPAASVVSTGAWAQKPLGQGFNSSSSGGRLCTAKSVNFGGSSSSMSRQEEEEEEGEVVVGLPQLKELRLKHCQLQKVSLMDVVRNPRVSGSF